MKALGRKPAKSYCGTHQNWKMLHEYPETEALSKSKNLEPKLSISRFCIDPA
jgi:hypothetical protein